MASPSTSPASSSAASSFPPFNPPPSLPVMALRDKIVEKVVENRVTLIIGDTGCGKSSQVPQFLLDEDEYPILCTQPRRFAVVAIARTVARARNCQVGGEVGYHIGHSKLMSARSKIVFKTAGVLLDEMLDKGLDALRYKVIILDEVHERSVESDLVLACVKQFMFRNHNLRVVLMSATADITRYRDYFKDLGRGERVEVLAIPTSSQQTIFQRHVLYLEQVAELLGKNVESVAAQFHSAGRPFSVDTTIRPDMQNLIRDLVLYIHETKPDIEKSILVFLPTYMALEQQWSLLQPHNKSFQIHILHSSIDIQQALMTMKTSKLARKVILATNIAESSVTIPGVAYVIDSCRSLQVVWDSNSERETSELVWVSKSQAEQRKGRTGRTCDGEIFRLVTKSFYNTLSEHESPSILRLSLRQQVLAICCAESRAISDPKVLMQKTLDPPNRDVVEDALTLLVFIHALEKPDSQRGRYEPTFYGRLLASLRLSFDASVLVLKLGAMGHLHEGILIGVLVDVNPLPIIQPFGDNVAFGEYIDNYFDQGNSESLLLLGKKEVISIANLCSYQFWQQVFKDKHRLEHLKQILNGGEESKATQSIISKLEEEWCSFHNLVQTSLQQVSDIYNDILDAIHWFRPKFLVAARELPLCYEPYEFRHVCMFQRGMVSDRDGDIKDQCLAVPYVCPSDFRANAFADKLVTAIKEIRIQHAEKGSRSPHVDGLVSPAFDGPDLCKFFANGFCSRGSECHFSHSIQAKRPICKFFFSLQGCRNGESCFFSHIEGPSNSFLGSPCFCSPEDEVASSTSFSRLLPADPGNCFLVLDDDPPCHFSSNLSRYCSAANIIATTSHHCCPPSFVPPDGVTVLWDQSHFYQMVVGTEGRNPIPWVNVKSVLWFWKCLANEEDLELCQLRIQTFFELLAIKLLADTLYDVQVILTMNNIRFAQLKVEKLARDCFFHLTESHIFDESTFGKLGDQPIQKRMQASKPISYVFDMHPPSDIQFGDYSASLRRGLYSDP